ncbi:MAG TPA: heavy metal translocating P-type ATPase [Gemmatimonadales bacterium]|nr:heavy metal translocating P-type ATPase [Gemmatimonadales bacterium]
MSRAILRRYAIVLAAAAGLIAGLGVRFVAGSPHVAEQVFLATILVAGTPLVLHTARGLARGWFAADVVAMLAILGSLALGQYFAGAVIVLMQSGGEALEAYAMGRASSSLEALLARAPKVAHRLEDEQIVDVPVTAVRPGDLVVVRPGDLVPVDGEVTIGTSSVDQAAITGEPMPIRAVPGTTLLSGSVNLEGVLRLRALRPSGESQYEQIVRMVEQARREKPPLQRLADRFAVWFTPATIVLCGLTYLGTRDPTTVLAVLVVATPCPLILATPVAVIAAISRAAREGIIVKSGAAIEYVGQARAMVFDKTGTLTVGHPTVTDVHAFDGVARDDVLRLAAGVEQFSSHPFGQAIVAACRQRFARVPPATEVRETAGLGVTGRVQGRSVEVGSASFLATRGIAVPSLAAELAAAFVAVDGRVAGSIEFADRLRQHVPELMRRLATLGIAETVMLTGDRQASAALIAEQAGIRTVRADLLPADKVAAVQGLKQRYGTAVMVGDGTNDAPALAAATVGIALGAHGSAVSAEAADIVILVDDVSRVADAVAISRRMRRVALQSIGIGLGASLALMVMASLGFIRPAAGALMQEALDAAVILNALRAR